MNDGAQVRLVGLFQYGYSVQGYGSLNAASAYYGMVWLTTAVIDGILESFIDEFIGQKGKPVVSVWSKGWGDVWTQMKPGLKITYNANTTRIRRKN